MEEKIETQEPVTEEVKTEEKKKKGSKHAEIEALKSEIEALKGEIKERMTST